ncbi:hypothetical protein AMAG_08632 [Allomyces macrogynus ATCC 38327]|uniref:ZP domain-containing protein n=1 Tax=Allomyces macrogynus (strain ATCC 38327) TaxID=578462 RepID=A0A0L0SMB7_ALLM3|nr:hypothetical protein AMAG_08632 [Allomyces macrogynus ATCC 38327]|eukprot:KNE63510.1 hypothetical protein AMAG_08632 [Allomyces macrogynus ATCC 38327]
MALSLSAFGLLLVLALLAHAAPTLALTPITTALDQWTKFIFVYPSGSTDLYSATLAAEGCLVVVDVHCSNERFSVTINGQSAGLTSQPVAGCSPDISTGDSNEADQALANPAFSRGYFTIGTGYSTFTFSAGSVDDDDRAWFKVTSIDCNTLLNPAPPAPVVNSTLPDTTTNTTNTTLPDTTTTNSTTLPDTNTTNSTLPTTDSTTTSNTKAHPAHPARPASPVAEARPPVTKPVTPAKPHLKLNDADGATAADETTAAAVTPQAASTVAVGPAMLAAGAVVLVAAAVGVAVVVQRRRRAAARGQAVSTEEGEAVAASRMLG